MKLQRKRSTIYDATYALVTVPPLIVAAMMLAGMVSWRNQSQQAQRTWDTLTDQIGGDSTAFLIKWYDDHKSKEQTLKFKQIVAASDAILSQFDDCSPDFDPTEIVSPTPPGQPLPFGPAIRELAAQAKPVLRTLASIQDPDANIWHPVIFDGADLHLPATMQSRSLMRLLKIEFLDAYHEGESQRAIEALTLLDRFYGHGYRSMCASEEMVCRDADSIARKLVMHTLVHGVWSEADLVRIQQLVSREFDWQGRWKDVARGEILLDLPWEEQPISEGYPLLRMLAPRSLIAPSEKHEIASRYVMIASTDDIATPQHVKTIAGIVRPSDKKMKSAWAPDQWLQLPRMNADTSVYLSFKSYAAVAREFAHAAGEQRLTRCAVAIKQFATRNHRLPASLNELASVGLPAEATVNIYGQPIEYELGKDRAMATLWSNAALPADAKEKRDQTVFWNSTVISK
jgi:hypothetical protein